MSVAFKTRSEIALAQLESLKRPLTDEESDQLRRALHATYCRNIRLGRAARLEREAYPTALAEYAQGEAETYAEAVRESLS